MKEGVTFTYYFLDKSSVFFGFSFYREKSKFQNIPLKIQKAPQKSAPAAGIRIHTNYQISNKIITSKLLQIEKNKR